VSRRERRKLDAAAIAAIERRLTPGQRAFIERLRQQSGMSRLRFFDSWIWWGGWSRDPQEYAVWVAATRHRDEVYYEQEEAEVDAAHKGLEPFPPHASPHRHGAGGTDVVLPIVAPSKIEAPPAEPPPEPLPPEPPQDARTGEVTRWLDDLVEHYFRRGLSDFDARRLLADALWHRSATGELDPAEKNDLRHRIAQRVRRIVQKRARKMQ
jgi:hypothetical protein